MKTEHIVLLALTAGLGLLFWQSQKQKKVAQPLPTARNTNTDPSVTDYLNAASATLDKVGTWFGGW